MRPIIRHTLLLTTLHALVDALCACCVFIAEPGMPFSEAMILFVTYNVLAFVTQPLVGWWADRKASSPAQLAVAIALLLAGGIALLFSHSSFLFVILIGLGNSLFHVYGGRFVAQSTGNDLRHLGIFVSSGALGLALGRHYTSTLLLLCLMGAMVLLSLAFILDQRKSVTIDKKSPINTAKDQISNVHTPVAWLFSFIVLVVFIRSFLGSLIPPSATLSLPAFSLWSMLLAVTGKASGGFIARRYGVWPSLTTVLLLAGICFLLGSYHATWLLAMVLFINLSMPLTLHLANRLLPGREGFAFGMLAAVLAPGVGLAQWCIDLDSAYLLLYPLIATIVIEALVLLLMQERRWQVFAMSVVMNVMTNVALNLYVITLADVLTMPRIILLEGLVFVLESALFYLSTRNIRQAILYSLACNLTSYLLGLLFETLIL